MTTDYAKFLAVLVGLFVISGPAACFAAQPQDSNNIWLDARPGREASRPGLKAESIERIMQRIRQADPQRADELAKLRADEPEAFKNELRAAMREQFGKRMQQRMAERPEQMRGHREPAMRLEGLGPRGAGRAGEGPQREMMRERMREKNAEYIEWLGQNFPDEAEKLEQLQKEKPELYMRKLMVSLKKYGRIYRASKDNPELAAVLKDDMAHKQRRHELTSRIKSTTDKSAKDALISELEDVIGRRFDLIVKRKQIAYEQLSKKLEELQKEVKSREADVEKWKSPQFKEQNVKARIKELLSQTGKFDWQ